MLRPTNMTKDSLRKEFGKEADRYYKVELFEKEGFTRKKCSICGKNFWSAGERDVCDDSSHTEYSFFKKNPVEIGYVEFWRKFSDFFRKNGHTEIGKYPVVSRWRRDLYFTIASIQDFQRIEHGKMGFEYATNPLIVPQMCIRFGDTENVGITGRHFTSFMMAGQHSFNYPKEGYWKDRCIELNYGFITGVLGVKKEDLVYSEEVWAMPDFSEFGPSLESLSKGAELVNSVFTEFEYADGEIRELEGKVVDVGWGFERLLWFYTGYDSAYEAVFGRVLRKIKKWSDLSSEHAAFKKFAKVAGELDVDEIKNAREKERQLLRHVGVTLEEYEKQIKPVQGLYAVLDHTRTLMFAIADGALPSNIGGGYNLRIVLRRAFDFMDKYDLGIDLSEVSSRIAEDLKPLYPELEESLDAGDFDRVIKIERERYNRSRESAKQVVASILGRGKEIDADQLKTLYESNGITPEFLAGAAAAKGIELKLPENIYGSIIQGDMVKREKKKGDLKVPQGLKPTDQLYYDAKTESKSKVLFVKGNSLVLDATPFYPEGGGQAADRGRINGIRVNDVQKHNGEVIVHTMDKDVEAIPGFGVGSMVDAQVDKDARRRLTAHHTATHLISAASRKLLGRHAWQEGTRKEPEKAHIDIAHYDKLSNEEISKIEHIVNNWIFNGIRVEIAYLPRGEAEAKYGFEIYQGHGIPTRIMRIVLIKDRDGRVLDAQACGGLHAAGCESILGLVKVINSYRSHDGIVRLEFVAGPAALEYFDREDDELHLDSRLLNAELFKIHERIAEVQEEGRANYDKLKSYMAALADEMASSLRGSKLVERQVDLPKDVMRKIADKLVSDDEERVVMLTNRKNEVICIAGSKSGRSAVDYLKEKHKGGNFTGGGSKRYAEGVLKRS